ncbi:MAG TPA: ABC transporter substrate-binding protein [Burkholderiales bacterium]
MPAIGFLSARTAASVDSLLPAFREGLRETGYVENRNVAIQYRWAEGRFEDLDGLAADLVALKVNVLVATGGNASAIAARKATGDIPIVFAAGGDPLKLGLVSSLSRPTGNVTGVSQLTEALEGKRLELLSVLLPAVRTYDVLMNRKNPTSETSLREISAAARVLKRSVNFSSAGTADEVDAVFAELARRGSKALLVTTDPFLDNRRAQVIALAARHSIPVMYGWREHALAGGLISYGTAAIDSYRQVGRYVGRILGGAKISELPVVSADPRMVINRKTAASLGLSVPRDLLLRADEVID